MKYCCVLSTIPGVRKARLLAGLLLSRRLAACVQILPGLESHYRWRGKIESSKELLLIIKTESSKYRELEKVLLENHPYEVPEIICLPIDRGSQVFLNWISTEVAS